MDPSDVIKEAVKQLFKPGVTQKIVRSVSKNLSSLTSSEIDDLTTECAVQLKRTAKDDPIQAIQLVSMLSEGSTGIQNGVIECLEEILSLIHEKLKSIDNNSISLQDSKCQEIFKALFSILQYLMPSINVKKNDFLKSGSYYLLGQIFYVLYEIIVAEKVLTDSFMIVGTSLSLLITYLNQQNRAEIFITVSYFLFNKKSAFDLSCTNKKIITEDLLDSVGASYSILQLVNGLVNSNLSWLYDNVNIKDNDFDDCTKLLRDEDMSQELNVVQSAKKNEEKNATVNNEDSNLLLYKLFPLIYKCCNSSSNYNCVAFQTLYMWIKCVRKLGKSILFAEKNCENIEFNDEKYKLYFDEAHILPKCSQHPAKLSMFAFTSENPGSVFAFLNANWESPVKGVSEVVRDSIMDLLEMHGDGHGEQTELLAMQMLSALVEGSAWGSKSTYPPLELALHYVGSQKALELYPELPGALTSCLSLTYLAPPATSVYKLMLNHLSMDLWCKYFKQHFLDSLVNTDMVTRRQALSLWLPPTLARYPQVTTQLLKHFDHTTEGWLARMVVLKIARSIGILNLENNFLLKNKTQSNGNNDCKKYSDKDITQMNDSSNLNDEGLNDVQQNIKIGLCHIDEMVRAEAFNLICRSQKTSEPLTLSEASLIKYFFTYNMNIDSSYFRQNIIKTFKILMVRVRDSCINQLKKSPYRYLDSGNFKPELTIQYEANECMVANCGLLLWLMRSFHSNFAPDSNYQRKLLSLQLYRELLASFYEHENCSFTYKVSSRCKMLSQFITDHGEQIEKKSLLSDADSNSSENFSLLDSSFYLYSDKNKVNFNGFILPWTQEMLYNACLDDMNDIREEAKIILQIIQTENMQINLEDTMKWFKYGLSLCDSPKPSEAESGAALVRIIDLTLVASSIKPVQLFKDLGEIEDDENIFVFLLSRLEKQYEIAKKNLLRAAKESPIYGTVMALNGCLSQTFLKSRIMEDKLRLYIKRMSGILISLVEFMLQNLAIASSAGSAVAPSFAEMSESIELILKECLLKDPSLLGKKKEEENDYEKEPNLSLNEVDDSGISGNYHLVLSCCWQTLKSSCLISNQCIQHCSSYLSQDTTQSLLRHVIVRVLTGTRHKGVMEAAKLAYSQSCSFLLTSESSIHTLIHGQVYEVLDQLEAGAGTSITRRGAGLAMMVNAACGAASRCSTHLIDTTFKRLINIANMDNVDDGLMDASPALSLHILQALVLNASLAHSVQCHLPNITIACITAFSSSSWGKRNAALQLYGSVVPRMVGQKKVKDDSSSFNSLTAPEFLSRHPVLADFLLLILKKVCPDKNEEAFERVMDHDESLVENRNCVIISNNKELASMSFSDKTIGQASYLVPVLTLLARLSPGTGLQQNSQLSKTLQNYSSVILAIMKSPVHTVRRLASLALISLTPISEIPLLLEKILHTISNSNESRSTNLVHGNLLILQNIMNFYPEIYKQNSFETKILSSLLLLIMDQNDCLVIKSVAINLYTDLEPQHMAETEITQNLKPGSADYIRQLTALNLQHSTTNSTLERYLFSNCQDEMELCIKFIEENILIEKVNENLNEVYESIMWKKLELESMQYYKQISPILKLFIVYLNKYSLLKSIPSEKSLCTLHSLLSGSIGVFVSSQALKITSHIIKTFPHKICGNEHHLKEFVCKVKKFANPVSTEDYRLAAAESLTVSLNPLLKNNLTFFQNESLISACVDLLQDEDSTIRDSACMIVDSLPFCTTPNENHQRNANLSLKRFIYGLSNHYIKLGDIEMFQILWKLCHGPLLQNLQLPSEILENDVCSYLFQSHTMNLYMEPKQVSLIVAQAIMAALNQNTQITVQDGPQFQKWIADQLILINKEGQRLRWYLKMEKTILLTKRPKLLIYLNRYIVASKLLVQLANKFEMPIILQHPIQFDNNQYCSILD